MRPSVGSIVAVTGDAGLSGRRFWIAFGALLPVDLAFILAHLLWASQVTVELFDHRFDFGIQERINLAGDHGYPEIWDGIKGVLTVCLLLGCFFYRRQAAYLGLAVIFALPHIDNYFQFHERVGGNLAVALGRSRYAGAAQVSELAAFAGLGLAILVIFIGTFRWSDGRARVAALIGFAIMALLAAFSVGVDLVQTLVWVVFGPPDWVTTLFNVVEDGGEMMVISLGLAFSYAHLASLRQRGGSLEPALEGGIG